VEVVEVLPTRDHLAVLDLEDDAAIRVEALAVALSAVVMDGHHPSGVTPEHLLQVGLEGAIRLTPIPAELGEDRGAANLIASDAAAPGRVPRAPNYLLQGGVTLLDRA
jgi:hypothetical protein